MLMVELVDEKENHCIRVRWDNVNKNIPNYINWQTLRLPENCLLLSKFQNTRQNTNLVNSG